MKEKNGCGYGEEEESKWLQPLIFRALGCGMTQRRRGKEDRQENVREAWPN